MSTVGLTPIAYLGGAGMIVVALGYLFFVATGRLSGKYLALGALAWVITVAVKFAWAVPLNPPIYKAITEALPGLPGTLVASLYIGSLTGFTEVLITWAVLRYTRLGRVPWGTALAFAVGFGAVEALLLGLSSLLTVVAVSLSGNPPAELLIMNNPLMGVAPIVERFFTVLVHIGSCVLIFLATMRRRAGWMWLAFLFKTGIDSVAGYAQLTGVTGSLAGIWTIEAVVVLFGLAGWYITRRVQAAYPEPEPAAATPVSPAQALRAA